MCRVNRTVLDNNQYRNRSFYWPLHIPGFNPLFLPFCLIFSLSLCYYCCQLWLVNVLLSAFLICAHFMLSGFMAYMLHFSVLSMLLLYKIQLLHCFVI